MQVFISYGQKSNSDLLGGYGFLVPGNIWDTYQLANFPKQVAEAAASGLLPPVIAPDSPLVQHAASFGVVCPPRLWPTAHD